MNFFTGVLTGLGALVAPLLLASLFLPGPDGTNLRVAWMATPTDQTAQSAPAKTKTEAAEAEALPELVTYEMPQLGIAIDLPAEWVAIEGPALTGKATEKRIKEALSVARYGPLRKAARNHLGLAYGDGPMLDVRLPIGVWLKRQSEQHPGSEVVVQAGLASLGPFQGGRGVLRRTHQIDGRQVTIDRSIWILELDRGWISLATTVADDDPNEAKTMEMVLGSLRKL